MPSHHQWWISPDEEQFHGPYETKEEAIQTALKDKIYMEDEDEKVAYIVEAQSVVIDDIHISARDLLDDLAVTFEECVHPDDGELFRDVSAEDYQDLDAIINQAFQMWVRDHNIKLAYSSLTEQRNEEWITLPKPE